MRQQTSRREAEGSPRVGERADISLWEYGVGILGLLAAASFLFFSGCSNGGLSSLEGELVAPARLDFGKVAVGSRASRSIEVRNAGAIPLQIVAIEAGPELAPTFVVPEAPGRSIPSAGTLAIELGFRPDAEERSGGTVILHTNSTSKPTLIVSLEGEGVHPVLNCSHSLDFGRIVLNTREVLPITCLNAGTVAATVKLAGKSGDDPDLFTVGSNLDSATFELAAGSSQNIDVSYDAHRLGKARARAVLSIPGAEDPSIYVDLAGEGYASDLIAAPNCLHFGAVSPGTTATREVIVVNGGDSIVTFDPPAVVDPEGVFQIVASQVDGVLGPLTILEPEMLAKLVVSFSPKAIGDYEGDLRLYNDDLINPRMEVCLDGQGGGPDLMVRPDTLDFGVVAAGMTASATIFAFNAGTPDGGPLVLRGVSVSETMNFSVKMPAKTQLDPNDPPAQIEVSFHPTAAGSFFAQITIESNDGDQPSFIVPIRGDAKILPPCDYATIPPIVRFGAVQLGADAQLVGELKNLGVDECIFAQVALESGSSPVFSLPAGDPGVVSVMPGESLRVPILFRTDGVGSYQGAVAFSVSNPAAPTGRIPITASSFKGCLSVVPPAVDFGVQRLSCPAVTRTVEIYNRCGGTTRITSAGLGAGSFSPGELSFSGLTAPMDLLPNQRASLQFTYRPVNDGDDAVPFDVLSSAQNFSIPLHGRGTSDDYRTDRFTQQGKSDVDVLFVMDNSGSMTDKQQNVRDNTARFMQYALNQGVDFHIGVTTTGIQPYAGGWTSCPGGVDGGEAGRLYPANGIRPRWIERGTPNAASVFAENVQVGICHWDEQGLEAAYRALSSPLVDSAKAPKTSVPNDGNLGFYRANAKLSVIIVSDEEDHSPKPPSDYAAFFRGLKGPGNEGRVAIHSVVGNGCGTAAEEGTKYISVSQSTGGLVLPICSSDWGSILGQLAEQSFGNRLRFPLSGEPLGSPTVTIDGVPATGWSYDSRKNEVVFGESSAPAPGASVAIRYIPSCGT